MSRLKIIRWVTLLCTPLSMKIVVVGEKEKWEALDFAIDL